MVTSRVVLGAPGEVCWTVPPLDCPSAAAGVADIAGSDAVQLFVARARERLPSFSVADVPPHAIGELCRRLDGLPLAIELIAGWVGALSVREILQQRAVLLDQDSPGTAPSRGRRLVDVVRASYDLLQPEEQRLLAVLSVFAGSFTLADAQEVSDAGPALAHLIRGLVDSSWLVVTRGSEHNRFSMLDTMRTFAAARLAESGIAPRSGSGTRSTSPRWPRAARPAWPGGTRRSGRPGWRRPPPIWTRRCNGWRITATSALAWTWARRCGAGGCSAAG